MRGGAPEGGVGSARPKAVAVPDFPIVLRRSLSESKPFDPERLSLDADVGRPGLDGVFDLRSSMAEASRTSALAIAANQVERINLWSFSIPIKAVGVPAASSPFF